MGEPQVLADGVVAPGAAAQRGGGIQTVVHSAAQSGAAYLIDCIAGHVDDGGNSLDMLGVVGVDDHLSLIHI